MEMLVRLSWMIFLFPASLVVVNGNSSFGFSASDKCEPILNQMCMRRTGLADLPYNSTRLPNMFGHSTQEEALFRMSDYWPLISIECSPYFASFMCSAFLPECEASRKYQPKKPCKELCLKARRGCQHLLDTFDLDWPPRLACDNLPTYDEKKPNCFIHDLVKPAVPTEQSTTTSSIGKFLPSPVTKNVTLLRGKSKELACDVNSNLGFLTYSWRKENLDSAPATTDRFHYELLATNNELFPLKLADAQESDAASYIFEVEDAFGRNKILCTYHVSVVATPRAMMAYPGKQSQIGTHVNFYCQVTGLPHPEIIWSKENGSLPMKRIELTNNNTMLTIHNLVLTDEGRYTCTAYNRLGTNSSSRYLEIGVPPKILSSYSETPVAEGDKLALRCETSGNPKPKVTWNKIINSSLYPLKTDPQHVLKLRNIGKSDSGKYLCVAENRFGKAEEYISIEVLIPPRVTVEASNQSVVEGEDATILCNATGTPPISLHWTDSNGMKIDAIAKQEKEHFSSTIIELKEVGVEDLGPYTCFAENKVGSTKATAALNIIPIKNVLRIVKGPLSEYVAEGTPFSLSCMVLGRPRPTVQWNFQSLNESEMYRLEDKHETTIYYNTTPLVVNGEDYEGVQTKVTVRYTRQEHAGHYVCVAGSKWGIVSAVSTIEVVEKNHTGLGNFPNDSNQEFDDSPTGDGIGSLPNFVVSGKEKRCKKKIIRVQSNTTCDPCKEKIRPRRMDIKDPGLPGYFSGWVDVTGQGVANDYCRIISSNDGYQLACALAGTESESEYNYVSTENLELGFSSTWYMKDEDGDGKDDYCRCVGEPKKSFVWCMKAEKEGFQGKTPEIENSGSQYSFKAPGKRKELRKCAKRKVDPSFGLKYPKS